MLTEGKSSLGVPCYIKVRPHDVMETSECGGCGTWRVARRQLTILDGLDCASVVLLQHRKLVYWRRAGCLRVLPNMQHTFVSTLNKLLFLVCSLWISVTCVFEHTATVFIPCGVAIDRETVQWHTGCVWLREHWNACWCECLVCSRCFPVVRHMMSHFNWMWNYYASDLSLSSQQSSGMVGSSGMLR